MKSIALPTFLLLAVFSVAPTSRVIAEQPAEGTDAIRAARQSAGEVVRAYRLGMELPVIIGRRLPTDLAAWREAAGKGDPTGMWLLGLCNYQGIGGAQSEARGRDLLLRAAESGDGEAMAVWSIVLRNGDYDTAPDPNEANRWLGLALQARSKIAADLLPLLAADELLAEGNVADAIRAYQSESNSGNLNATVRLARVHSQGFLAPPNEPEFLRLLERAAKHGHVKAMLWFGQLKCGGIVVERNMAEGRRYVESAVATGDPQAMTIAAYGYDYGALHDNGIRQPHRATELYNKLKAAPDPRSRYFAAYIDWHRTANTDPKFESELKPMLIDAAKRGEPLAFLRLSIMAHGIITERPKDPKRAHELLRWGADAGDIDALYQLASAARFGWYAPADEARARALYFAAANRGSPSAMTSVGMRFLSGRGVEKDPQRGFFAYLAAAISGDPEGCSAVAQCYLAGDGVPRDLERAKKWAQIAATWGDASAYSALLQIDQQLANPNVPPFVAYGAPLTPRQIEIIEAGVAAGSVKSAEILAEALVLGRDIKQDVPRALNVLESVATKDFKGNALLILGNFYLEGKGVPKDPQRAVMYFRQAADRGNEEGWALLAVAYTGKRGLPANPAEVRRAGEKAVELGSGYGADILGRAYLFGMNADKDTRRGIALLEKAVEFGYAQSAIVLGDTLLYGREGVPVDVDSGLKWLAIGVDAGYGEAAQRLAHYYREQQDWKNERVWLERGHAINDPDCTNGLGVLYRFGRGVPQDFNKAAAYYRVAADAGVAVSMGNLAWCYEQGNGVEKNLEEAHRWALKGAEKDDLPSMFHVGRMYIDGIGTTRNAREGLRWIAKAADAGDPRSKAIIEAARAKGIWK